jgi:hypothetical protein
MSTYVPSSPVRITMAAIGDKAQKLHVRGLCAIMNIRGGSNMPAKVNWKYDADAALAGAKEQNKPVLLDFSATPG